MLQRGIQARGSAVEYYNSEQENLGLRFQAEVVRAIGRMVQYPSSYQK